MQLDEFSYEMKDKMKRINIDITNKQVEKFFSYMNLLIEWNKKINLTKTEYAILKQLFLNPTQVISKNKLLDLISIDTDDCDENSLKVHISNIRKKIKKVKDKNYIESVWGIGFKMSE